METRIDEVKLTKRTDYTVVDRTYAKPIEYLYDADKYVSMCTFKVDGVWFYSVLVMRDGYLEPHFGRFFKGKLVQLIAALKTNNIEKLKELSSDAEFIQKDGYANQDFNMIKVLSYVFSFMTDYLEKKEIGFVKVMGNPRKFKIYKKLVQQNLETLPYKIIKEIDDKYVNKDGSVLDAKAIVLKYNFA